MCKYTWAETQGGAESRGQIFPHWAWHLPSVRATANPADTLIPVICVHLCVHVEQCDGQIPYLSSLPLWVEGSQPGLHLQKQKGGGGDYLWRIKRICYFAFLICWFLVPAETSQNKNQSCYQAREKPLHPLTHPPAKLPNSHRSAELRDTGERLTAPRFQQKDPAHTTRTEKE